MFIHDYSNRPIMGIAHYYIGMQFFSSFDDASHIPPLYSMRPVSFHCQTIGILWLIFSFASVGRSMECLSGANLPPLAVLWNASSAPIRHLLAFIWNTLRFTSLPFGAESAFRLI